MTHGATARLFVAVDPPGDVCRQLSEWTRGATRRADEGSSLRVLDPELLHVTLCFLGSRPAGEIELLGGLLGECEGAVGKLSVGAPLWLPPRHPRALAVELHDEDHKLARLQTEVVEVLDEVGDDGREQVGAKRHFRPHVTVARMGHGVAPRERVLPPTPALSFVPTELILYRSWLSPEGASYEAMVTHPIG
ncbi:MAG: RNA 2',3'-cyclic phosphodiesterase [Solirubrobacteraceae bacterium]